MPFFTTRSPLRTIPRPALSHFLPFNERSVGFASLQSWSFVVGASLHRLCATTCKRPCLKLRAFNFGHPCPPSKKGEVLLLSQAQPTMVGIVFPQHHHYASRCNPCYALPRIQISAAGAPQFFILHYSSFIVPFQQPSPISRSLSPLTNPNFKFRTEGATTILHSSSFIIHYSLNLSKHHPFPSLRPSYKLLSLTL